MQIYLVVHKLFKDDHFKRNTSDLELATWIFLKLFLGNQKSENCRDIMVNLLGNYKRLRRRMSLIVGKCVTSFSLG